MFSQSPIIKTGVAFKKGSGAGLFHRQNWKQRYLVLTLDALYYYDQEHHGHLKGCIDLSTCDMESLEVMPADCVKTGHSAASEWRVAIQTPDRRFVFAAPCEKDMREWVFALTSVLRANERLMQDHYFTKSMGHNHHHIQNPHRSLTAPSSRPR
ncbi:hypothetical protein AeNC1_017196 [Aphanomyces euteiches]|nr:hypothetical protein AeNC1_017196 [Aphanomyces euteiches]